MHAIVAQAAASALQDHIQGCSDQQHHQLRGLLDEHECCILVCTSASITIVTIHIC